MDCWQPIMKLSHGSLGWPAVCCHPSLLVYRPHVVMCMVCRLECDSRLLAIPSVCWPTSSGTTTAGFKGSLGYYCQTLVAKFTTPGVYKLCITNIASWGQNCGCSLNWGWLDQITSFFTCATRQRIAKSNAYKRDQTQSREW